MAVEYFRTRLPAQVRFSPQFSNKVQQLLDEDKVNWPIVGVVGTLFGGLISTKLGVSPIIPGALAGGTLIAGGGSFFPTREEEKAMNRLVKTASTKETFSLFDKECQWKALFEKVVDKLGYDSFVRLMKQDHDLEKIADEELKSDIVSLKKNLATFFSSFKNEKITYFCYDGRKNPEIMLLFLLLKEKKLEELTVVVYDSSSKLKALVQKNGIEEQVKFVTKYETELPASIWDQEILEEDVESEEKTNFEEFSTKFKEDKEVKVCGIGILEQNLIDINIEYCRRVFLVAFGFFYYECSNVFFS